MEKRVNMAVVLEAANRICFWMDSGCQLDLAMEGVSGTWVRKVYGHSLEVVLMPTPRELKLAAEIATIWRQPIQPVEIPLPSPGGSSAPSGGNDEGFGPDGTIVTAGSVPSTGCPNVGEEVEISPIGEE